VNRISAIVNGHRGITADTALRLAQYFGNSSQYWMNLQALYDLEAVEPAKREEIHRDVRPLANGQSFELTLPDKYPRQCSRARSGVSW
jgi:plasmid maintenance system antidote protein VapI